MAFSAANSTPKRRTTPTPTPSSSSPSKPDKTPIRRSRSVSAASRSNGSVPFPSKSESLSDEFLNKRDNPLYGCSSTPSSSASSSPQGADHLDDGSGRRGRSVSRSSGSGSQSTGSTRNEKSGRSLSRIEAGRRKIRSVSREHYGNSSETDREHNYKYASSLTNKEDRGSTSKVLRKSASAIFDAKEKTRNLQTWTRRHPISESWDASSLCSQSRNWEDGTSTSSFSEAEEPIVSAVPIFQREYALADDDSCAIYETVQSEVRRAVSEIRGDLENAFCRKNLATVTTENTGVTSPGGVNPDELVSDVTKEYASKLEQSQERARKLRADLAVEEQREQELSRILTEIIHTPRNNSQKSRPRRKASIERLRMSRRLAEEAMNYFDECVSISTFESSDFSSLEDPQPNSFIGIPHMSSSRFFQSDGSNYSIPDLAARHATHLEEVDNQPQCSFSIAGSDIAINSSYSGNNTPRSGNFRFSSGHNTMKTVGVHDIDQYVMKFDKGSKEDSSKNVNVSSSYRHEDYELSAKAETLIFDSLILRSRIESGGLLLCNIRIF